MLVSAAVTAMYELWCLFAVHLGLKSCPGIYVKDFVHFFCGSYYESSQSSFLLALLGIFIVFVYF